MVNFGKIKTYLVGLSVAALAFVLAFFTGKRSGRQAQKNKAAQATRKTEKKATDALLDGLTAEETAKHEKLDPDKRYFD